MIITKKQAIKLLRSYARTDEELDFLDDGEKQMKKDPKYDVVKEYILNYPTPPEFSEFMFGAEYISMSERRFMEYFG